MKTLQKTLKDSSVLIIFAYAPAGFGHLRVTDALYQGLTHAASPIILGTQDKSITYLHRLMSVHEITREFFEWIEAGIAEEISTIVYRGYLRYRTSTIYNQIITILDQRLEPADTIVIVATHFGLAHQIGAIKERLIKERKVKIILAVQVTDDSPHHIWYIPGADIIMVPSEQTKKILEAYGKTLNSPRVPLEVNPYPVDGFFSQSLTDRQYEDRKHQLDIHSKNTIHVMIPISGAAVGTDYFTTLIDEVYTQSHRFLFHVITKDAPYTKHFIDQMNVRSYVKAYTSTRDREVINQYRELYGNMTISLEVTKPSEQAFKSLCNPTTRGGSILLFSQPVGRQEYDNLDFLYRHNLIPSVYDIKKLWKYAKKNKSLTGGTKNSLFNDAKHWRGILLPVDPKESGQFIIWCMKEGLLSAMMHTTVSLPRHTAHSHELLPNGVELFWEKITNLL